MPKEILAWKKNVYHPSALLSGNISNPLSSVSEFTSPSPSSWAAAGHSSSNLDIATALAQAALRDRFANLTLNGSNSNEMEVKECHLPLNSLNNITRPFTCPGCHMDFESFSGFVLHIENRLSMSSIEDQLNACVTQFSTLSL